jgi:uncharacterized protein YbbC (DUF1343 family)
MRLLFAILLLGTGAPVRTGLEILEKEGFKPVLGKRVGLVTNHSALDPEGRSILEVFSQGKGFTLAALFSPEHGLRGAQDTQVPSSRDPKTGLLIHSLYGPTQKPTPEMLKDLDVLVYDIQDIGARYYTYITTLALVMQAAREAGKAVLVLDRPNAVGGLAVEGPVLEEKLRGGFSSYYPLPTRHGMTVGELALLFNTEFKVGCALEVVKMEGWNRSLYFDQTGLPWVNPSPNMRSLEAAILYSGLGPLEGTNLSVGRGTDRPFQVYGAPWIKGVELCEELNRRGLSEGIRFRPASFTPEPQAGMPRYPFTGTPCSGFEAVLGDRTRFRPVTTALHVLGALYRLYPKDFSFGRSAGMLGRSSIAEDLRSGKSPDEIEKGWEPELEAFLKTRKRYLLYP